MATTKEQVQILSALMEPILEALGSCSESSEVSADDILDLFAHAIAAVIDNDRHLKTSNDLRLGVASAAQKIHDHVTRLRKEQRTTGVSEFTRLLAAFRSEAIESDTLN